IGVEGTVFKTHTGETTIRVSTYTILTKTLRPMPEKWHGLTDKEQRYRMRYVDLICNPQVKDTFIKRTKMLNAIRKWYTDHGFLEVETPVLQPLYGGANARPFVTHLNAMDMTMYLRIAPELYLKRLVVGGIDRVFEITRNFRNEGMDAKHNPEFTAMESYQAYGDIEDAIHQTEEIVAECARICYGSTKFVYEGVELDVTPPWPRLTMSEAVKKYTGEDFDAAKTLEEARAIADRLNVEIEMMLDLGEAQNWCPPIERTIANKDEGVADVVKSLGEHRKYLEESGLLEERRRERARSEMIEMIHGHITRYVMDTVVKTGKFADYVEQVYERETDPFTVVDSIVGNIFK
ncbi:MAG: amino acid--tRNA ligase-related protein, partial [Dialister micraerophilus]|nr:amino acid--tRNA ligase-related protein [Dialister micraerophilus]